MSVWTKNQPPVNAPLKDNQEVDVAVIGGGQRQVLNRHCEIRYAPHFMNFTW